MTDARVAGMIVLAAALSGCALFGSPSGEAPAADANATPAAAPPVEASPPSSAEAQLRAAASTVTVAPAGVSTPTQTLTLPTTAEPAATEPSGSVPQASAPAVTTAPAGTAGAKGKIRVCKLGDSAAKDSVYLPADGTYSISCAIEDKCRNVKIGVTAASRLAPGRGSCATLDAVLLESDGQPIRAGQHLVADWSTGMFMPVITVVKPFK